MADAEAEAAKKTEERAKVWKTHAGSNSTSPNTTPNTSVEIAPRNSSVTSSKTEPNPWSQPAEPPKGDLSKFAIGNIQWHGVILLVFAAN